MMILLTGLKSITAKKLDLFKFKYDENIILSNLVEKVLYSENYYIVTEKYMLFLESELQYFERKIKAGDKLIQFYENEYRNLEKYQLQIKILLTTTLMFSVSLVGVVSGIIIYCILNN